MIPQPELFQKLEKHKQLLRKTQSGQLLKKLIEGGHGGFLSHWRGTGLDVKKKEEQLRELLKCDRQLKKVFKENIKGLPGYLDMCQKLLEEFRDNQTKSLLSNNLFQPPITDLQSDEDSLSQPSPHRSSKNPMVKAEELGLKHIDKIGLVLVAGGLGERLGSKTAKVSLKIHYLHHHAFPDDTFLGFYLQTVIALQKLYTQKTGKVTEIPLLIMCSEHNRENVLKEVRAYSRLGIHPGQVVVEPQLEAPCMSNLKGDLALEDNYRLIKKPLGHGFIHTLIQDRGYLDQPALKKKKYLFFLQDTNPQSVNTLLSGLGITWSLGYIMSWIGVKRRPGEQAGLIVGQELYGNGKNHNRRVVNIEYNRLEAGMKLPSVQFFANTNNFWLRIREYRQVLARNHGIMPFMINPKPLTPGPSSDSTSGYKPFRPETLMQDIAQVLPPFTKKNPQAGVILYPRHLAFSPVKNPLVNTVNLTDLKDTKNIKKKYWKEKILSDIAYTPLELELNNNRTHLEKVRENNTVNTEAVKNIPPMLAPLFRGPRIILDPTFKLSRKYFHSHIEGCSFHPQSLLVVKGGEVYLRDVELKKHGALIVYLHSLYDIRLIIEHLTIDNHGFSYIPITQVGGKNMESKHLKEEERNRGYRIVWKQPLVIKINQVGNYRYGKQGLKQD